MEPTKEQIEEIKKMNEMNEENTKIEEKKRRFYI